MVKSHDLADHILAFSVRFSDHHFNTRPFDKRTQIYHLNNRLVGYSDVTYKTDESSKCDFFDESLKVHHKRFARTNDALVIQNNNLKQK